MSFDIPRSIRVIVFLLAFLTLPIALLAQFGSLFGRTPAAPEVTVNQLRKLQTEQAQADSEAQSQGRPNPVPSFVLVDVRAPEEVAVSMIPGAITQQQFEKSSQRFRDGTVIVYCTIGYRSGQYASKLIEQGFTAKNFKGSILAWCEANQPLVTPQGVATNRVHTYSSKYKVSEKYKAVW